MKSVVLVATHEKRRDRLGTLIPMPLVDLAGEPYLTTLARRLAEVPGVDAIHVVVNEAIRDPIERWRRELQPGPVSVNVISDGTLLEEDRKGAVGDLIFAVKHECLDDDLLIVGGDNWFTYNLADFIARARGRSPAVVLTRVAPGVSPSRFGWVELTEDSQIAAFREHPSEEQGEKVWKASCVYYFARAELEWLNRFAREHSTVCSPGTFLQWLQPQIPCYGIPATSQFAEDGSQKVSPLRGPDYLEWRDLVRCVANPYYSTWERQAARHLVHVSSYEELVEALRSPMVNVRIVAARLLGRSQSLTSEAARKVVVDALLCALEDPAQNEFIYGGSEQDESESCFVSATAARSLVNLGYGPDVSTVLRKAQVDGRSVHGHHNTP